MRTWDELPNCVKRILSKDGKEPTFPKELLIRNIESKKQFDKRKKIVSKFLTDNRIFKM